MRLGVLARSEDRGLGVQTWEVCRHLRPERVLLVEPNRQNWPVHRERYSGFEATPIKWRRNDLDESTVRRWLDGLDAIYTAETFYDLRLPHWAREAGVTPICHVNPELLDPAAVNTLVVWWAPTSWRLHRLPFRTRVVPMPVAVERFEKRKECPVPSFLHVAGHAAMQDRNGTLAVQHAVRRLSVECRVTVAGQDGYFDRFKAPAHVDLRLNGRGVRNYWELYPGHDVLLMPRRYGGLCLPCNEALAAGLAVVMTDCSPNDEWPGPRVPVLERRAMACLGGQVEVCDPDPDALVALMEKLAGDEGWRAELKAEAEVWAQAHSWEALLPVWRAELERACSVR